MVLCCRNFQQENRRECCRKWEADVSWLRGILASSSHVRVGSLGRRMSSRRIGLSLGCLRTLLAQGLGLLLLLGSWSR